MPRRSHFSVSSANHRSTRLSQLEYVGVKCSVKRGWRTIHRWIDGRLVRCAVVDDDVHVEIRGDVLVDQVQEPAELLGAMAWGEIRDDLDRTRRRARRRGSSCRCGCSHGCAARACPATAGTRERSDPTPGSGIFSSTHNTTAASGGFRYNPTMSRTLSMNNGSGDSLKLSTKCGFRPNARQIRLTADWVIPVEVASERVDQCVALAGVSSSVLTITRSTSSSPIDRGAPGRGSSCSPSRRRSMNRRRHFPTVVRSTSRPSRDFDVGAALRACQHDPTSQRQRLRGARTPRPTRTTSRVPRRSERHPPWDDQYQPCSTPIVADDGTERAANTRNSTQPEFVSELTTIEGRRSQPHQQPGLRSPRPGGCRRWS